MSPALTAIAAVWVATATTSIGAVTPAPLVMPGWPKPAAAGRLFPGPGGGVVSLGNVDMHKIAAAYTASGRLLWAYQREPRCGNCITGTQRSEVWPNGTYGPLGATGSDYWAVDRRGRGVTGCKGPVLGDGACLASLASYDPVAIALNPAVTLSRGSGEVWRHVEADLIWGPDIADWPAPVVDLAGNVYAAFGNAFPGASGLDRTRVIALDPVTGALRWRRLMPARVVDGLESGVLVDELGRAVALDAQGNERWRLDAGLGAPIQAIPDPVRGRVLITLRHGDEVRAVSVRLSDGTIQWMTPGERVVQSVAVGRSGIVYVGLDLAETIHQVRAYRPDGTVSWLMPAGAPVVGVREIPDRTVMVASSDGWGGLLVRVDPRREAPPVEATTIDIRPRRMAAGCGLLCGLTPARGGILTIRTPSEARMRFFVVGRGGKRRRSTALSLPIDAQRGTTHLRFVAAHDDGIGPVLLEARWRVNGKLHSRRLTITVAALGPRG